MDAPNDRFNDPQTRIERFTLAAHRLVMTKLRADPRLVDDLQATIARWRAQGATARSEPYMQEWERLLLLPLDELEVHICADNDHATVLRSVSPIGWLLTQQERDELRAEARETRREPRDTSKASP